MPKKAWATDDPVAGAAASAAEPSHAVSEAVISAAEPPKTFYGHNHFLFKIKWLHHRPISRWDLSVAEMILIVLFIAINIPYLMGAESSGSAVHYCTAAALFPITKQSAILYLLNVPWDRAIRYHRWIGRWVFLCAAIHTAWELDAFYGGDGGDRRRMRRMLLDDDECVIDASTGACITGWKAVKEYTFDGGENFAGILATFALLAFTLQSLPWIRRSFYKFFQVTHWMLFPIYVVFTVMHYGGGGFIGAIAVPMILFIIDLGFQLGKSWTTKLNKVESLPGDVIRISFPCPDGFAYEAGQYVFLARAGPMGIFEWHPFTLSSSPDESDITVHIRAYNNWTKKLIADGSGGKLESIRCSPAYGVLSVPVFEHDGVLMLLCAGIGCTPMMSIAKSLFAQGKLNQPALKGVYLVWAVRDADQLTWFDKDLDMISAKAPGFKVKLYVTRQGDKGDAQVQAAHMEDPQMGKRPDLPGLFDEVNATHPDSTVAVLTCGPTPLCSQAMKLCGELSSKRNKESPFLFHTETFEL